MPWLLSVGTLRRSALMIDDKKLISQLLADDLIDQTGLDKGLEIAEQQGTSLYDAVICNELAEERAVVEVASDILNVPCVHLDEQPLDRDTAQLIPAQVASDQNALPLEVLQEDDVDVLQLAMIDPIDVMAMDEIADHIDIDIRPVLAGPADLQRAIDRVYSDDDDDAIELTDAIDDDDDAIELSTSVRESFEIDDSFDADESVFELDDDPFDSDDGLDDDSSFSFEDAEPVDFSKDRFDDDEEAEDEPATLGDEPVGDDDSWAAMFDDVQDDDGDNAAVPRSPRPEQGSGPDPNYTPDSREMRDRPPTGVLDAMDDDLDEDDDLSGPAFSQHPAMMDNDGGTAVASPAALGDWDLDEKLEKSGAARLRTTQSDSDSDPGNSTGSGGLGNPVDSDEWGDDYGSDVGDQTSIGVGTHGELDELEALDFSDDDDAVSPLAEETEAAAGPASSDGIDAPDLSEKDDADSGEDEDDDDDDSGSKVPKSIRAALNKAKSKASANRDAADAGKADDTGDTGEQKDGAQSALGRIAVKKKRVSTSSSLNIVEKRSDRQQSSNDGGDDTPDDDADADAVDIPDDVDSTLMLQGLLELLVDRDVLSPDDVEQLIEQFSE